MRDDLFIRRSMGSRAVVAVRALGLLLLAIAGPSAAQDAASSSCPGDNGEITLPPGFCANGVRRQYRSRAADGGGAQWGGLRQHLERSLLPQRHAAPRRVFTRAAGHHRRRPRRRGSFASVPVRKSGNVGGTGIALYRGALYTETNDRIVRYALPAGAIAPSGPPEVIVSGLPLTGDHPMHPFKIDAQGNLFVDLGSATNSCQSENRMPNSPGIQPCTELETRAGIWRYDVNRTEQRFSPAERFATGLRNSEGIAFSAGRIFVTQHGRDQLRENWPHLYTPAQGANEPAEELVELERGADYGWPYCYFRSDAAQARACTGIRRRRRQNGRAMRRQARTYRRIPRALGAQRSVAL